MKFISPLAVLGYVSIHDSVAGAYLRDVRSPASVREESVGEFQHLLRNEVKCKANPDSIKNCAAKSSPRPVCTPNRSSDHCPLDKSFSYLIQSRHAVAEGNPRALEADGHFFHLLEHKVKAYIFSTQVAHVRAPKIYDCISPAELESAEIPPDEKGFVIRATNLDGSFGTFVFPEGFGERELLSGLELTAEDVIDTLSTLQADKVLVEEYFPGDEADTLPTEYKVHVINGEIASINVVYARGAEHCGCWAEVDDEWNRLDQWGCFEPSGFEQQNNDNQCYAIDFATGKDRPRPVENMDICDDVIRPSDCLMHDIKRVATSVASKIGAYVRIDLFVASDGQIVVRDYNTNHLNGLRHCSARWENGCVNSCFMGEMWHAASGDLLYGGPSPGGIPSPLVEANQTDEVGLCLLAKRAIQSPVFYSSCRGPKDEGIATMQTFALS